MILSIEFSDSIDSMSSTEFYSGVLMPGIVNAHTHLELSYMRGGIAQGCGFAQFASQVGQLRSTLGGDSVTVQRAMVQGDIEMYNCGVVAACDVANSSDALRVKKSSSIHYHTFVEVVGLSLDQDSSLPPLQGENSSLTPHSTYSVQDSVLRRIVDDSGDAPLSIHFMESPCERAFYRGEGDIYELFCRKMGRSVDFLEHGSPARRLTAMIPPHRKVLLVHNTCVEQEDIDTIMSHFTTPPTWVLSPRSNHYITGLTPPVELLRHNGLSIAIGTDSLASNYSLNPLEELTMMEDIPLAERLSWITKGGAEAMALDHLGEIEVGRRCGLNILSGIDYQHWQLTPQSRVTRIL